ncbi:hypothetical protein K5V07_14540 [Flavobacterium sp. CHNK8]|uniref:hypothetical protein n=1 Tax=Flavobacterium sp. CHNK8 TaxID=2871165 RepID=UPI001C8E162E|nr:hypothetical protein [Flavobacterium sp. CHNK8]QZK91651.1 hypothetical protein K5V07_14540 [Flavobacterium sp. CHNK8]
MTEIIYINTLFQSLQNETPNCGGQYHFTKIDLQENSNTFESLKEYMLRYDQYRNPYYFDERTNENVYIKWRDPTNLILERIEKLDGYLENKLEYWSKHRTSLDCLEEITSLYKPLETEFKNMLLSFLNHEIIVGIYSIGFVDTCYCFGHDHVNDDTLIQTTKGSYILHFGWSS